MGMLSDEERARLFPAELAANPTPVPTPTASPHSSHSCHGAFITTVRPDPTATRTRAALTTRRMPNRSMSAAAKGAVRP